MQNRADFDNMSMIDNSTVYGDGSTVVGDNMSMLSVPYKDGMSRPGTPSSQMPLVGNPRLPAFVSRTNSPFQPGPPRRPTADDYFTRPASRGAYRSVETPGYTPGYTPSEAHEYELNAMPQRSFYPTQDVSDQTSLLYDHLGRARERSPPPGHGRGDSPPPGRGGYM
jgi:hypothetical protein